MIASRYSYLPTFLNSLFQVFLFLNVGSFGAIPALSHIFEFTKLSLEQKAQLFSTPLVFFLLGAVFSLFSAFAAYLNFQFAAAWQRSRSQHDISAFWLLHPQNHTSSPTYQEFQSQIGVAKALIDLSWRRLQRCFLVSIVVGTSSMLCFIGGCCALAYAIYHLP